MAKTVITTIVDDIDGSPAAETVSFALDGHWYDVDLSEANAARLRKAMAGFVVAARVVQASRARNVAHRLRRTVLVPRQRVIRDWAVARGIDVNERGRIPQGIVDQYMAATS